MKFLIKIIVIQQINIYDFTNRTTTYCHPCVLHIP